jgi:hypothetical protein
LGLTTDEQTDKRTADAVALDASAAPPISTHGRYFADPPTGGSQGGSSDKRAFARYGRDLVASARELRDERP